MRDWRGIDKKRRELSAALGSRSAAECPETRKIGLLGWHKVEAQEQGIGSRRRRERGERRDGSAVAKGLRFMTPTEKCPLKY